jgi:hypothetical protein
MTELVLPIDGPIRVESGLRVPERRRVWLIRIDPGEELSRAEISHLRDELQAGFQRWLLEKEARRSRG